MNNFRTDFFQNQFQLLRRWIDAMLVRRISVPYYFVFLAFLFVFIAACENTPEPEPEPSGDLTNIPFDPTDFVLEIPDNFPPMPIPEDNPMTTQGVLLGRMLFYDPILSADSTMSCSSCHFQESNFTDNLAISQGIAGEFGTRSSMVLLNIGFNTNGFFWDGRSNTLEEQALLPVEDPIELNDSWPNVEAKLKRHSLYPRRFREAFGIENTSEIDRQLAVKAIAQFERSLVSSGASKYDRVIAGVEVFTDQELDGHNIFFDIDPDINRHAECGHCHNAPLFTTNQYFNNGIENVESLEDFPDKGRGSVTGSLFDNGTFRVPTLRNIDFSAPYMHDGRFNNFDEVLAHYSSGGFQSLNIDPVLRPLSLSETDRNALISFIKTLQEPDFLENPAFSDPF